MAERLDLDAIRHRWAPDLWDRNAAVAAAMQARQDVHALITEVERLKRENERLWDMHRNVSGGLEQLRRALNAPVLDQYREALEPVEGVSAGDPE
jgi:hypothetical protein